MAYEVVGHAPVDTPQPISGLPALVKQPIPIHIRNGQSIWLCIIVPVETLAAVLPLRFHRPLVLRLLDDDGGLFVPGEADFGRPADVGIGYTERSFEVCGISVLTLDIAGFRMTNLNPASGLWVLVR